MLILVRHGRTPANAAGLLQGRLDQALDEVGERQAAAIAEFVQGRHQVGAVVSSPMQRAQQTAEAFGMPVEVDDRWVELAYGIYEGKPHRDLPSEVWEHWRQDPGYEPPEGESLTALGSRVRQACGDLAARAEDQNVVVVSHVSPIKAAVEWALGVGIEISWTSHLDPASVSRIQFRNGNPVLTSFNETAGRGG